MYGDVSYADYKSINAHQGYSIGFNSDIVKINDLEVELLQRFEKHLCKAKGILMNFAINGDENLHDITDTVIKINNFNNNYPDIIFASETDNSIKMEECKFEILITGLETI